MLTPDESGSFAEADEFFNEKNVLVVPADPIDADSDEIPEAANRQLVWNAAVKSSVRVKELGRSCEEYMRLPASECKRHIINIDFILSLARNKS